MWASVKFCVYPVDFRAELLVRHRAEVVGHLDRLRCPAVETVADLLDRLHVSLEGELEALLGSVREERPLIRVAVSDPIDGDHKRVAPMLFALPTGHY